MGKRKNKRRLPNAQRSIDSLNQEFGFKPDTDWVFEREFVRLQGDNPPVNPPTRSVAYVVPHIDAFPHPWISSYHNLNDKEDLADIPVLIRPMSPDTRSFPPGFIPRIERQRYYPLRETPQPTSRGGRLLPADITRELELPITLGMFDNFVESFVPENYEQPESFARMGRSPMEVIRRSPSLQTGIGQVLYGQWLQKERMGRSDDDLARVRQALASQDVNALERLLYDFQAWLTPDRGMWIDYMNQHAKKMGIDLQPRAPSDPPRQPNPKKEKKRKRNPRRIKNAEVTPSQLTKYFELPASTRWARSPVANWGAWTTVEPDEIVRAYPRLTTLFSGGRDERSHPSHPRLSLEFFEEHPTNLNPFSAANYIAPILKRHKTPAAAKKLLNQIPVLPFNRPLGLDSEGAYLSDDMFQVLPFARAGYLQSLYGDLLRLEMEGRIARGLGTGYDQTLAKIRDALSRRDEEAMGRILYDLQAYRTPERDDLIDYMNMAAKRSGLNLALASHPFMGLDVARLGGVPPKPWSGLFTDPRHILPRRENPKKKQQKKKPSSSKATRR